MCMVCVRGVGKCVVRVRGVCRVCVCYVCAVGGEVCSNMSVVCVLCVWYVCGEVCSPWSVLVCVVYGMWGGLGTCAVSVWGVYCV